MKEPDKERGWHIEIDIGRSSMCVHMHACTKTVGTVHTVQLHRTGTPIISSHPPMVRLREIWCQMQEGPNAEVSRSMRDSWHSDTRKHTNLVSSLFNSKGTFFRHLTEPAFDLSELVIWGWIVV